MECRDSTRYAAKLYFDRRDPGKDRVSAELGGLKFLWDNGERAIPRPVAADPDAALALYEYVDGAPALSTEVSESDVDRAVEFLVGLKLLAGREGAESLPPATEACFSVGAILDNISWRLARLQGVEGHAEEHMALRSFLSGEFVPEFRDVKAWCEASLRRQGLSPETELDRRDRTLSPSDFGFHNAIRRPDGQVVYLDFEYFGWDDPAKIISDFLHHPGMALNEGLKDRFWGGMLDGFHPLEDLGARTETVYPLWGLRWGLILLNEFVPEMALRRAFASRVQVDQRDLRLLQLGKARRMLERVRVEREHFPYRR